MSCTPRTVTIFSVVLSLTIVLLATAISAPAQTFNSLMSFDGADGSNPYYVYLVQGTDGQLYGTTYSGGAYGYGSVFKVSTSGAVTTLYSFCSTGSCTDGANPAGGLLLGTDGNFYGTTLNGGANGLGTVFKVTTTGTLTTLYSFCAQSGCTDGYQPYVGLIQASNGTLYGTTSGGGSDDAGTVFSITTSGKFTSLLSFSGAQYPDGRLVQGANGNLYGTTYGDTAYEITSAGKLTILHTFSATDGTNPTDALVQAGDGTFYGTTTTTGAFGGGTIFSMSSAGKVTVLYNFCTLANCADGQTAYGGLILATDGNLYGTTAAGGTYGFGTVFEYSLSGKVLTTLYDFCPVAGCPDGANPYEGLLQDTNGTFYGTTHNGGTSNLGTVFSVATGLGPFVAATASSGKVAAKVTILGTGLTGATAVTFDGVAATFKVNSTGTAITTNVPTGAETGNIQVTTPDGTLTSKAIFKVTPQLKTFSPPSGTVGTPVTITGVSLTQTTAVTFGGVKATFTVNSDTQVTATVPSGAKTGKIVITTLGGTASSTTNFTVTAP